MKKFLGIELRTSTSDAIKEMHKQREDHPDIPWPSGFPPAPIFIANAFILITYSTVAATSLNMLDWIDRFVTPVVESLRYIGLGVSDPMIVGPMPETFYSNLIGLGVWGALVFNTRAIFHAIFHGELPAFPDSAVRLWMVTKNCGRLRAWIMVRLICYFLALPWMLLFIVLLLNGINGWWVEHVGGMIQAIIITMIFVVGPGSFIVLLGLGIFAYVADDIQTILRLIRGN